MKFSKALAVSFAMIAFVSSGCGIHGDRQEKHEVASAINEAGQKTSEIENGSYTYELLQDGEQETNEIQGEGTFIQTDNQIDWYTRFFVGGSSNSSRAFTEEVQKSGIRYRRFGTGNEENQFIDEGTMEEWQVISEESSTLPLYLEELKNIELQEGDIETVEVSEEEGHRVYELTYTEEYRSSVMEETIEKLQTQLAELSSENPNDPTIVALEQTIDMQQNTTYTDSKARMTVDESNVLTSILREDRLESTMDEHTQAVTSTLEITLIDYNDPDLKIEVDI